MVYKVEYCYTEYILGIAHEPCTNNKHLTERNISNSICITQFIQCSVHATYCEINVILKKKHDIAFFRNRNSTQVGAVRKCFMKIFFVSFVYISLISLYPSISLSFSLFAYVAFAYKRIILRIKKNYQPEFNTFIFAVCTVYIT